MRWLALVVVVVMAVSACTGDDDERGGGPTSSTEPTPSTERPNYAAVVHSPVEGTTTTTLAMRPGPSRLAGTVLSPRGPVPFAQVEVTRLVGSASVTEVFTTSEDGRWDAGAVLGGRYRVRAWRSPSLAQVDPEIFFLDARAQQTLNLELTNYEGAVATASLAPDPFGLDERVQLVARIGARFVDERGVVRVQRQPGVLVELLTSAAWTIDTENPTVTDGVGDARWVVRCHQRGEQGLAVVISEDVVVNLPSQTCGLPPTTTSEASPSTTSAGRSTTTDA